MREGCAPPLETDLIEDEVVRAILRTKVMRLEDAVFSINQIEFVPEQRSERGPRSPRGGKRPARAKAD